MCGLKEEIAEKERETTTCIFVHYILKNWLLRSELICSFKTNIELSEMLYYQT